MINTPLKIDFISANGSHGQLHCTEVLRELLGRRVVYDSIYQDKPVITKIFTDFFAWYRCRRERLGLEKLASRGIPCPKVVCHGKTKDGHRCLVIEKIISGKNPADLLCRDILQADGLESLGNVFALLGQMHLQGITQNDMHLGNFIQADSRVYALNPARMKFSSAPLSLRQSYLNVAALLARFPKAWLRYHENFLRRYCQTRQLSADIVFKTSIEKALVTVRRRYNTRLQRRISRPGSRVIMVKQQSFQAWFCRRYFNEGDIQFLLRGLPDTKTVSFATLLAERMTTLASSKKRFLRLDFYQPDSSWKRFLFQVKAIVYCRFVPVFPKYQQWLQAWENFWNKEAELPPAAYLEFYASTGAQKALLIQIEPKKNQRLAGTANYC